MSHLHSTAASQSTHTARSDDDKNNNSTPHHAALERTWLAYHRTANQLASHGIIVLQAIFLHRTKHRALGKVCCTIMLLSAMLVTVVGLVRYTQQAHALLGSGRGARPSSSRSSSSVTSWSITSGSYAGPVGLAVACVCVMLLTVNFLTD